MKYSALDRWLDRRTGYAPSVLRQLSDLDFDTGGFIGIDECYPIHQAGDLASQSLEQSWNILHEYVARACEITSTEHPFALDREEVWIIRDELGDPPSVCWPIYFIVVEDRYGHQEVVYVGQTSSSSGRFLGGHAAITKLHDPVFSELSKKICLGSVMLVDKETEYVPIEAIGPLSDAKRLLTSIENALIFHFQPKLNNVGRARYNSAISMVLHVQNCTSERAPDEFVFPPKI